MASRLLADALRPQAPSSSRAPEQRWQVGWVIAKYVRDAELWADLAAAIRDRDERQAKLAAAVCERDEARA